MAETMEMSALGRAARAVLAEAKRQNPDVWMDHLSDDEFEVLGEQHDRHPTRFHSQHEPLDAVGIARAVLQAIREPSEGMTLAGHDEIEYRDCIVSDADDCFRAMIDAALAEGPEIRDET